MNETISRRYQRTDAQAMHIAVTQKAEGVIVLPDVD
jgi:hypothetical protein